MKLLHCLKSPKIGGIERLVIELVIAQKKMGIDVSLMLDCRDGEYYKRLNNQNIPIIDSNIKGGYDFNPISYINLKEKFNSFEIIHLHHFSTLASLAAFQANPKVIYTIHGLSKGVRKENLFKYHIREFLKKKFLNRVDFFVGNSNYSLQLAKSHYGLEKIKSGIIYNGIKIDKKISLKTDLNEEFTIGLVSRFTPRKRIDRLLKGFKIFIDKGGKGKVILCGSGSNEKKLKKLSVELGIEKLVSFEGYIDNIGDYYPQFSLLVHPSDNEGFGLVAVEAYLFGKSVLAFSDSGGLKEVIHPLEPENIVNSEEELASRLLYLSKKYSLLAENSAKRIEYAQKNFSIERMANEYQSIYDKVLKT